MTWQPRDSSHDVARGPAGSMTRPRILAIMGSGETAPAMAKVHRDLFGRFDAPVVPATLIDTPYGFQENADDLSDRIVEFFAGSIGRPMSVASFRSRDVDALAQSTALARISAADYVLSGPGSPSYALRQWAGGPIPEALARKLRDGGIVTMASAAALTLGLVTIPVYEIYKVGEDARWLDGLDILGDATGLRAAVVPHYDNAEGGNHDTRFCYIGEGRLRALEEQLPAGAWVLGVDSHSALVFDLAAGSLAVHGLGGVTVRVHGRSRFFEAGTQLPISALAAAASDLARHPGEPDSARVVAADGRPARPAVATRRLADVASTDYEAATVAAIGTGDMQGALEQLLAFDSATAERLRAGEDSAELDDARAVFRSLLVRFADAAPGDGAGVRATVGPLVDTLLELRTRVRDQRDWATADLIRDRLAAVGVEVRDGAAGSEWVLSAPPGPVTTAEAAQALRPAEHR